MERAPFTIITNRVGPCSKSFTLSPQGLKKTSAANVYDGLATRMEVSTLAGLNGVIAVQPGGNGRPNLSPATGRF